MTKPSWRTPKPIVSRSKSDTKQRRPLDVTAAERTEAGQALYASLTALILLAALLGLVAPTSTLAYEPIQLEAGVGNLPNAIALRDRDVTFVDAPEEQDFLRHDSPGSTPRFFSNLDGQTDAFVRPNEPVDALVEYVDRITFPASGGSITELEVCMYSERARSYDITFVMYNNSGGSPGNLRRSQRFDTGRFEANQARCFRRAFSVSVPSRSAYFGVRFSGTYAPHFGVVATTVGSQAPTLARFVGLTDWVRPAGRSLAIGVYWRSPGGGGDGTDTSSCRASSTTVCLLSNRFEVKATFRDQNGGSGDLRLVEYTNNTSLGHFGDSSNIELILKVLDGCGLNGRYWIFIGGVTDQGVTIRVRDTRNGQVKTYSNPLGTAFKVVTDTGAMSGCS